MRNPKIRFKGYADAWEQRKFSDVFTGLQNNTLSRSELNYESGTVKNVHYGDVLIKFGDYIDASKEELPFINDDSKVEKFKGSFLHNGDIVIADTAEDETVGKCTEIQGVDDIKLISGLHTIPCRPKEEYGAKFLGYYMNSSAYHAQLIPLMQGIKVTSISKSALQDTNMIIPKSVDEQTIIGEYFFNLDHLITLHQRKCEEIKTLKKFMLQKMFPQNGENVPEIRFDGFTDAWEQRKFGELYEVNNERNKDLIGYDKTFSIATMTYKGEGNGAADSSLSNYKVLRIGDIAFEGHTNKEFRYGRFVANDIGDGIMSPRFSALRPLFQMPVSFWKYYIHFEPIMKRKLICSTKAGTMMNELVTADFFEQSILVPSIDEQTKIGEFLSSLAHLITLHQRKCDELQSIKKFMLQNMFV